MRRYCFAIFLLFSSSTGFAQLPPGVQIKDYNESNGISNGKVKAMLQARNGFLWFGTTNGLLRFDGYGFRQYNHTVIRNTITVLGEDSNHCIWMGFLGGGVASFNPATGVFTTCNLQNAGDPSMAQAEVGLLFFDSKGRFWLSLAQKGLVEVDIQKGRSIAYDVVKSSDTTYTPELRKVYNGVYAIHEDENGLFWLATHDGLYRFNPQTKQMLPVREKPLQKRGKRLDLFVSLVPSGDTLWLGAWAGGISWYNRKTAEWKHYLDAPDALQDPLHNIIISIADKNPGELWISSVDKGVGIFSKSTGRFFFNQQKADAGVSKPVALKLITDKDKNLWALTNEGLKKISLPDHRFVFTPLSLFKNPETKFNVTDSWEDETLQLTGTNFADGLHVLNKVSGKTTVLSFDVMPSEEPVMAVRRILEDSRGNIWVLTRDFLYQYNVVNNTLNKIAQPPCYTADNPSNNFTDVAEDNEGNLWLTTRRNGAFVYHASTQNYLHYGPKENGSFFLNAAYLATVAVDARGRAWLGGPFHFLGYADPVHKKITELRKNEQLPLPGTQTLSLFADKKGNIWAGSYNGLYHFDCSGNTPVLKKIIGSKDGLRSNLVTHVAQDPKGNIWCITEAAVCRIDALSSQVSSYDAGDGIMEVSMNNRITFAPDNTLRLLSANGYYSFQPSATKAASGVSPLAITKMMVNDAEIYFEDIIQHKGRIDLSPSQNVLSFEFAAIDFNRPERQHYRYKLEGFDTDWIDAGSRRFVTYTNLRGGNYRFLVKASTNSAQWDVPTKEIPFHLQTVFYKTVPFLLLVAAFVFALVFGFYSYRLRQTRSMHRLQLQATHLEKDKTEIQYQNLINQFNPHFLFNSLTSLNSLIYENKELASDFLEQLSAVYRYLLTHKETQLVTLAEEAAFAKHYISLLKTRFDNGLQVHVEIPEQIKGKKLVPVTFQLMIENALKHNQIDETSPLIISITADEYYVYFTNNLQRKAFVETSNRKGLESLQTLYKYLSSLPLIVEEKENHFAIRVPLL